MKWLLSDAKRQLLDLVFDDLLNDAVDWQELGFVCDGRFLFAQRSLQNCMLPDVFRDVFPDLRSRKS